MLGLLAEIDARLYLGCGRLVERWSLYRLARAISFTGDGYFYVLIAAIALVVSPAAGQAMTVVGLIAFAIELPVIFVLKKLFKRKRPHEVLKDYARIHDATGEFSFPSGHATGGFMAAWVISHFFPWSTIPVYLWAVLIGMSRLMLRVHFASDVIASVLLGTGLAMLALRLVGP